MIDRELVESNIITVGQSLVNRTDIGLDYAYALTDVFSAAMIEKIKQEFDSNTIWDKVDLQENSPRKIIPWKSESVIEEVYMVFQELEQEVSDTFSRQLKLQSVNFWQDSPGYTISPHIDNNRISVAMQIYINQSNYEAGTEMYKDHDVIYKLPWVPNTGYILNNTDKSIHGMMTTVNTLRQHIYVIFK